MLSRWGREARAPQGTENAISGTGGIPRIGKGIETETETTVVIEREIGEMVGIVGGLVQGLPDGTGIGIMLVVVGTGGTGAETGIAKETGEGGSGLILARESGTEIGMTVTSGGRLMPGNYTYICGCRDIQLAPDAQKSSVRSLS